MVVLDFQFFCFVRFRVTFSMGICDLNQIDMCVQLCVFVLLDKTCP